MLTTAVSCWRGRPTAVVGRCWLVILVVLATLGGAQSVSSHAVAQEPAPGTPLEGWLAILWRDAADGSEASSPLYFLATVGQRWVALVLDSQVDLPHSGILPLNRQHVVVTGVWVTDADSRHPTLRVSSIRPTVAIDDSVDDIIGPQPWISILCKFADIGTEPQPLSYFQGMYASTYPGLDHYWREQSYDLANVLGSGAVGWYTLPHPWSYYVYDQNGDGQPDLDHTRAANDCTAVADADVYFPDYVGINLMFNANLDCCAWGGSMWLNLDGVWRSWRVTWEPPWGWGNVTVISHEMGHGFGLPHSSGMYGLVYDNHWDVMSDAWANCAAATHPVYGCMGQHTISPYKNQLGWIPAAETYEATVGSEATIFLERTALPTTDNYKLARIPILSAPGNFYSLETRQQVGYDFKLYGTAVIIHRVEGGYAYVLDPDGNGNTGDVGAMWKVGETFTDVANETWMRVEAASTSGFTVTIHYGSAYDISGYVRDTAGNGIEGVSVAFGGARPAVTTDATGFYSQSQFSNGGYTVTLSRSGYTFSPVKHQVTVSDANATHDATGYPLASVALPFADGFESGALSPEWAIETDYMGRVSVSDSYPHTGTYSLLLDDSSDPRFFSHAAAILALDLSAVDQVDLSFWWREFADENHTDDGVFISDDYGGRWARVVNFNNGTPSFVHAVVDLDEKAALAGMTLNDHVWVKFQFYDDDPIPADGYAIDDVLVTGYSTEVGAPSDLSAAARSSARIALTWVDNSPDETAFHVERSPDGLVDWTEMVTLTENITAYADSGLACATPYHYRVRAFRAAGNAFSDYSNIAQATTLSVPRAVTLTFPIDGYGTCAQLPAFTWTEGDGASLYRIEIDDDPGLTMPLTTATSLTPAYTPTLSLDVGTYYWRVQNENACGGATWSPVSTFTVVGPPVAPTLDSPPDGSTTGTLSPTFQWLEVSGAVSYSFELATSPDFTAPLLSATTVTPAYMPDTSLPFGTYYWRARASNTCTAGAWSAPWSVTIAETPAAPILSAPPDGSTLSGGPTTFTWQAVHNATAYRIEVDDDPAFSSPEVDGTTGGTSYHLDTGLSPGSYSWRVRATNAGIDGGWSSAWAFTVAAYRVYLPVALRASW